MTNLLEFHERIDAATVRFLTTPQVAKLHISNDTGGLTTYYIVVGTWYGYIHTVAGDIRTWNSYAGARKKAKQYIAMMAAINA